MAVTYDRPVEATLIVRLANGDEWKAKDEDLERFGYAQRLGAYIAFQRHLTRILTDAGLIAGDLTKARLNPLRYLAELAIMHPELLEHPETAETDAEVVEIERTLEQLAAEHTGTGD